MTDDTLDRQVGVLTRRGLEMAIESVGVPA